MENWLLAEFREVLGLTPTSEDKTEQILSSMVEDEEEEFVTLGREDECTDNKSDVSE